MGLSPFRAQASGLIAAVLLGGAAQASELMRMPFECRFDGERVNLRPSEDRTYAILGRRDHQILTACSPTDPDRCGSWLVQRFDFDCNGTRVAWLDAAEAASRFADWDAWVLDGRFQMRMSPAWGVARARSGIGRRRWRGAFAPRPGMDAFGDADGGFERESRRIVTAPSGFAPAVGIPLTFSGSEADVAEAPVAWAPAVAANGADPARPTIPELPERAPPRKPAPAAPAPATAAAAPTPAAAAAVPAPATVAAAPARPAATTQVAAAHDVAPLPPPQSKDLKGTVEGKSSATAESAAPTIINGPHAAAEMQPSAPPTAPPSAPSSVPVAAPEPSPAQLATEFACADCSRTTCSDRRGRAAA